MRDGIAELPLGAQHRWCRMNCRPVPGYRIRPHRYDCPFNPRFRPAGTGS